MHCYTGNYYGKGIVRKHELYKSAMTLGIRRDHVTVVNDRGLPDVPNIEWQPEVVGEHVSTSVEQNSIETVSGNWHNYALESSHAIIVTGPCPR